MFGIPVRENASELQSTISVFSGRAEVLRHPALIVWEEFPMVNKAAIDFHVIETRKRVLGQEHPSTLPSMANLASGSPRILCIPSSTQRPVYRRHGTRRFGKQV